MLLKTYIGVGPRYYLLFFIFSTGFCKLRLLFNNEKIWLIQHIGPYRDQNWTTYQSCWHLTLVCCLSSKNFLCPNCITLAWFDSNKKFNGKFCFGSCWVEQSWNLSSVCLAVRPIRSPGGTRWDILMCPLFMRCGLAGGRVSWTNLSPPARLMASAASKWNSLSAQLTKTAQTPRSQTGHRPFLFICELPLFNPENVNLGTW